jgi:NADH-quinone oxidoreductase subunit F
MAVCAYAIGATQGYIYLRGEYPFMLILSTLPSPRPRRKGFLKDLIGGKERAVHMYAVKKLL